METAAWGTADGPPRGMGRLSRPGVLGRACGAPREEEAPKAGGECGLPKLLPNDMCCSFPEAAYSFSKVKESPLPPPLPPSFYENIGCLPLVLPSIARLRHEYTQPWPRVGVGVCALHQGVLSCFIAE